MPDNKVGQITHAFFNNQLTNNEFLLTLQKELGLAFNRGSRREILHRFTEGEWQPLLLAIYLERTEETDKTIQTITGKMILEGNEEVAGQAVQFLKQIDYKVAIPVFESVLNRTDLTKTRKKLAFQAALEMMSKYHPEEKNLSPEESVVKPYESVTERLSGWEKEFPATFQEQLEWKKQQEAIRPQWEQLIELIHSKRDTKLYYIDWLFALGLKEEAENELRESSLSEVDPSLILKAVEVLLQSGRKKQAFKLLTNNFPSTKNIDSYPYKRMIQATINIISIAKDEETKQKLLMIIEEKFNNSSKYRTFQLKTEAARLNWIAGFRENAISLFEQALGKYAEPDFTRSNITQEFRDYLDLLSSLPCETDADKANVLRLFDQFYDFLINRSYRLIPHWHIRQRLEYYYIEKVAQFDPKHKKNWMKAAEFLYSPERSIEGYTSNKFLNFLIEQKETDTLVLNLLNDRSWGHQFNGLGRVGVISMIADLINEETLERIVAFSDDLQEPQEFLWRYYQYLPTIGVRLSSNRIYQILYGLSQDELQNQYESRFRSIVEQDIDVWGDLWRFNHYIGFLSRMNENEKFSQFSLILCNWLDLILEDEGVIEYQLNVLLDGLINSIFGFLNASHSNELLPLLVEKFQPYLPAWRLFEFQLLSLRRIGQEPSVFKVYREIALPVFDKDVFKTVPVDIWKKYLEGLLLFRDNPGFYPYLKRSLSFLLKNEIDSYSKFSYIQGQYFEKILPVLSELTPSQVLDLVSLILRQPEVFKEPDLHEKLKSALMPYSEILKKEGFLDQISLISYAHTPVELQRYYLFGGFINELKTRFPEPSDLFLEWMVKILFQSGVRLKAIKDATKVKQYALTDAQSRKFFTAAAQTLPKLYSKYSIEKIRLHIMFLSEMLSQHPDQVDFFLDNLFEIWIKQNEGFIEENLKKYKYHETAGLAQMLVRLLVALEEHSPELDLMETFYQKIKEVRLRTQFLDLMGQEYICLIHDLGEVKQYDKQAIFQQKLNWIQSELDKASMLPQTGQIEIAV